jgi:hypothetical protein
VVTLRVRSGTAESRQDKASLTESDAVIATDLLILASRVASGGPNAQETLRLERLMVLQFFWDFATALEERRIRFLYSFQ